MERQQSGDCVVNGEICRQRLPLPSLVHVRRAQLHAGQARLFAAEAGDYTAAPRRTVGVACARSSAG